jgi:hypothetical protein
VGVLEPKMWRVQRDEAGLQRRRRGGPRNETVNVNLCFHVESFELNDIRLSLPLMLSTHRVAPSALSVRGR